MNKLCNNERASEKEREKEAFIKVKIQKYEAMDI
jgi:hypothetical protein